MPGPFYTRQDLITEALAKIGALSPGQPIDPEDSNYVNNSVPAILSLLNGLEIVDIPDIDSIPDIYFISLAAIVAGECATKFGVTAEDYVVLKNAGLGGAGMGPNKVEVGDGEAAKALRQIRRLRPTGQTVKTHYY